MRRKNRIKLRTIFLSAYILLTLSLSVGSAMVEEAYHLPKTENLFQGARWHSNMEIAFGVSVLVFGAIIIGIEIFLLKARPTWGASWFLKIVGLTLVLTAGLFLVVAGFSQNQTAPMMALLGTVAGYLLGKEATVLTSIDSAKENSTKPS